MRQENYLFVLKTLLIMTVSNLFNLSHYVSNNDLNSAKWCKFADSRIGKIHLSISDAYTDL